MGDWWLCPACPRMLPSPVCLCHTILSLELSPPSQPSALIIKKARLEVEHGQFQKLLGREIKERDWPTLLGTLTGQTITAECALASSPTGRGHQAYEEATFYVLGWARS